MFQSFYFHIALCSNVRFWHFNIFLTLFRTSILSSPLQTFAKNILVDKQTNLTNQNLIPSKPIIFPYEPSLTTLHTIPPTRKKTCCIVLIKLAWLPALSASNRQNTTTTIVSQRWLIVDVWGALNPVSCPVGCIFSVGHVVGTGRLSQWTGTPKASQGRSLTIHVVCAVVCTRVEPERFRRFGHFHSKLRVSSSRVSRLTFAFLEISQMNEELECVSQFAAGGRASSASDLLDRMMGRFRTLMFKNICLSLNNKPPRRLRCNVYLKSWSHEWVSSS